MNLVFITNEDTQIFIPSYNSFGQLYSKEFIHFI